MHTCCGCAAAMAGGGVGEATEEAVIGARGGAATAADSAKGWRPGSRTLHGHTAACMSVQGAWMCNHDASTSALKPQLCDSANRCRCVRKPSSSPGDMGATVWGCTGAGSCGGSRNAVQSAIMIPR